MQATPTTPAQQGTTPQPEPAAPYTLHFTEWECGHHGQRPADIPVHSIEQADLILQAIGCAISQPGSARAVLFSEGHGSNPVYLTDDYAEAIAPESGWSWRPTVYHGSTEEIAELLGLQSAFDYAYGGELHHWDGTTDLDGHAEVITAMTPAAIEAATAPVNWYEAGQRPATCTVPPTLKPAAELLAELREFATEMAEQGESA